MKEVAEKKRNSKRVSVKLYIREEDNLKFTKAIHTLKARGWRQDETHFRIQDKIVDELFSKANESFYENIISQLTPLEYLCREGMKDPSIRSEMEKILKGKTAWKK